MLIDVKILTPSNSSSNCRFWKLVNEQLAATESWRVAAAFPRNLFFLCRHADRLYSPVFLKNLFSSRAAGMRPIAEAPPPLSSSRGGGAAASELGEGEGWPARDGWWGKRLVGRPPAGGVVDGDGGT